MAYLSDIEIAQSTPMKPITDIAKVAGVGEDYLEQYGKPVTACASAEEGVALAKKLAGKDGVVLAYGSLYMLGDVVNAAREN